MADIRRDVGDVSPNTYIRQGVEDNSMSTIVGGLAEQGIKLDTTLAQHRLYEEVDAIATQREIGSPVGIAAQEQAAAGVDPSAAPAVQGLEAEMARAQQAYKQGRMTHDQMMILSERAVRKAIARRPGLAQEFRALAAQRVGRDVVGATVDYLAQKDADLLTEASKKAQDEAEKQDQLDKRRLDEIQKAGGIIGDLTSSEAIEARWRDMQPAIMDRARLEATAAMATDQRSTHEASLVLRRERDTALFSQQAAQKRIEMLDAGQGILNAIRSGAALTDEQLADVVVDIERSMGDYAAWAAAQRASGTIDPAVIDAMTEVTQQQLASLNKLVTGELPLELKKKKLESWMVATQEALLISEPQLLVYGAGAQILGEAAIANIAVQPGMQLPRRMVMAVGEVAADKDDPRVTTNVAGDLTGTIVSTNFGKDADPELVSRGMDLFNKFAQRFVTIPDDQAVMKDFTGPAGFVHKLDIHKHMIRQRAGEEQSAQLANSLAQAAYAAQRRLGMGLVQEMPSLRDKVQVQVMPDGSLFQVKAGATLTPTEQSLLLKYNQGWQGHKVLRTIAHLATGREGTKELQQAAQLVAGAGAAVQAAQEATRRGSTSPTPQRPAQGRTGASGAYPNAPAVGTVKDGYRYTGGNPALPSSWEKQ